MLTHHKDSLEEVALHGKYGEEAEGSAWERCVVSSMCVSHRAQWVSMDTVPLGREYEECCEEGVCSPRLFHVLCVPPSMHYMHCMSVGLGRKEES